MYINCICEDDVSKLVLRRILQYINLDESVEVEYVRCRGGEIEKIVPMYNILSKDTNQYTIVIGESDGKCIIQIRNKLLNNEEPSKRIALNIADDEVEAWLLADTRGFSRYLGIKIACMPKLNPKRCEIETKYKSSYYICKVLAKETKKKSFYEGLKPVDKAKKGKEYNSIICPFIEKWDIEEAMNRSTSLSKAIKRIKKVLGKD